MEGHSKDAGSVAFSPDGSKIISASKDGTIRLWDAVTGAHLNTLESPEKIVSVAFSPDGTAILSSAGLAVSLWNVNSGAHVMTVKTGGHRSQALFSADGTSFFSGSGNGVGQWEVISGLPVESGGTFIQGISLSPIALSRDGKTIVAHEHVVYNIHVWHTAAKTHLVIKGSQWAESVAVSPDGALVAFVSYDTIGICDAITGRSKMHLQGHTGLVKLITFSPDGTRIASASWDYTTRVWDVYSGALLNTFTGHGRVSSVAFSPDGSRLAAGSYDGPIRVWKIDLAIGPDCAHHKTVPSLLSKITRIFSTRRNTKGKHPKNFEKTIIDFQVTLSPDNRILNTSLTDKNTTIWDAVSGAHLKTLKTGSDYPEVSVSPDGTRCISFGTSSPLRLWNTASGTLVKILERRGLDSKTASTLR